MAFQEELPDGCPPLAAHENGCEKAFRFIPIDKPLTDHFASHKARGDAIVEGVDPCRWASCSLYPDWETVQKKRKLKSLSKYPFVAELKIAPASGKMIEERKHIDFWAFDTFKPLEAIIKIRKL